MPGPDGPHGDWSEGFDGDSGGDSQLFDCQEARGRRLELAHSKDAMVEQPALQHVNELVVAAGVGWQQEESGVDQIANGVVYDSLHDFAIEELEAHPDAMDDGRPGVEVEMVVFRVSIEAVDVEDSLDVLESNLLHLIRIETADAKGLRRALGSVGQQFFDGVRSGRVQVTLDCPGAEPDHDLFRLGPIAVNHRWPSLLTEFKQAAKRKSGDVSL